MSLRDLFFLLLTITLLPVLCNSQDCCDTDGKLIICYTAAADYCTPPICNNALDAPFMTGLRAKIENPANFGPMGISECEVETIPLQNINSSTDIEDLNCDIVFLGSFYTNPADITETTLPVELLNSIKEWSVICLQNLCILSQGETSAWGYQIANQNTNPNTPDGIQDPNIFNGVFGSITSFNQGGTFQANFETIPVSGATVLAMDALSRPTVVVDNLTNDILLADVGIISNGNAGEVTDSPNVSNDNDILACNIFALGCKIAGVQTSETIDTILCPNATLTLADGMIIDEPGEYTSNLISTDGCDSILITNVIYDEPIDGLESYMGCIDDGYSITVGNTVFDQANPTGTVMLENINGCDSTVNVELIFNEATMATIDTSFCVGESIAFMGITYNSSTDTILTITNANNCDSIIRLTVNVSEFMEFEIEERVEVFNNDGYTFQHNIPASFTTIWEPAEGLSCADCPNPSIILGANIPSYNLQLISEEGCETFYTIDVDYTCTPYIPNIFSPNSTAGNMQFGAETPCLLTDYTMIVYDRWGSIVFNSDDPLIKWDGKINQRKDIIPGVYVYSCRYSNKGVPTTDYGTVTLVR